ncbi:immunoglobulin-like domain-containing protein [Fictibacillus aquaticus]|uniref:Bacterial Ig-like domain-containing protein n=1 Tax=Fictibacillus aquaticus TaxID=2021314 RepID=A0A235F7Q1_9BACL|nr:immunoglobulin-like domain-containing protein [Fictibacillus aquaticus]OYD57381.1 hypothetical protein CGZ90_11920 [Fictibacillus aquaticus]
MKRAGILLAAVMFMLAGCGTSTGKEENSADGGKAYFPVVKDQGVEMKLEDGGSGKSQLVITNNTKEQLTTGMHYKLEKKTEGGWELVNSDMAFTEQAVIVEPGKSFEQEIELNKEDGEHRISKQVFSGNGNKKELVLNLK